MSDKEVEELYYMYLVRKTKMLTSCVVNVQRICTFVITDAKDRVSYDVTLCFGSESPVCLIVICSKVKRGMLLHVYVNN